MDNQDFSIDTLAFWMLLDRYRESPTAQRSAVGSALIAYIDAHTLGVITQEIKVLVNDIEKLRREVAT